MAPTSRAFIEQNDIKVQVIGHRNSEEKQDNSAGKGSPFAKRVAPLGSPLARPLRAPQTEQAKSHENPQNVEKQFHLAFLSGSRFNPASPSPISIYYAIQLAAINCS
jgi:hypothetical protein